MLEEDLKILNTLRTLQLKLNSCNTALHDLRQLVSDDCADKLLKIKILKLIEDCENKVK